MRAVAALAFATTLLACADAPGTAASSASGSAGPAMSIGSAAASSLASKPDQPWPKLPRTQADARTLIDARTVRDPAKGLSDAALSPPAIEAALSDRAAQLVSGHDRIVRWVDAALTRPGAGEAYLLFGALHDSGGQIDEFRRLVGPLGVPRIDLVAVEPLRADGAWDGVAADAQRGDDRDLAAWFDRGDRAALERLAATHATTDYAAWKFGYEASAMELVVASRASSVRLVGCDMPAETKKLVEGAGDAERLRLRELHCLQAIARWPTRGRVALLFGQSHVRREGLRRFLPAGDVVVALDVLGHRSGEWTAEGELAKRVAIVDPILIPLDDVESVVLYPAGDLAASVDRVRDEAAVTRPGLHVSVRAGTGTLHVGARSFELGTEARVVSLEPSDTTWVVDASGVRFAGAITVPAGGAQDVVVDPAARSVSVNVHAPSPPR